MTKRFDENRKTGVLCLLAMCGFLVFAAGCANPEFPATAGFHGSNDDGQFAQGGVSQAIVSIKGGDLAVGDSVAAGSGTGRSADGGRGDARTIMPPFKNSTFDSYRLTFKDLIGDKEQDAVNIVDQDKIDAAIAGSLVIPIEIGKWDVTGTAYVNGVAIASGMAKNVVVAEGTKPKIVILISPIESGYGTFSWDLDFTENVKQGMLILNRVDSEGNTSGVNTIIAVSGMESHDVTSLRAGGWRVRLVLDYESGKTADVTENLHVYQNLESKWNFTASPLTELLDIVLGSWNGTEWNFRPDLKLRHMGFLEESYNYQGIYRPPVETGYEDMDDLAKTLTPLSKDAKSPVPYTLKRFKILIDAARLKREFVDKTHPFTVGSQHEFEAQMHDWVQKYGNDSPLKFDWNEFKGADETLHVTVGGIYEIGINGIELPADRLVLEGPSIVSRPSSTEYKVRALGGSGSHFYLWDISNNFQNNVSITPNSGDSSLADLEVSDKVREGSRFTITVTDSENPNLKATATVTVSLGQPYISATASGELEIYNDTRTVNVAVTGGNISGADGTVNFTAANLSRAGEAVNNMPRGVTVTGNYTVSNGELTGTLILGGVPSFTETRNRTITLTIDGASDTFNVTILDPPKPELTAGTPEPNPVIGNSSVEIELDSKYLPWRGMMILDPDKTGNGDNSVLQVEMPDGFTFDKGSQFYNDVFTSHGTGFLRMRVAADIQKGTYKVRVKWAADPTVFVDINVVADWEDEDYPIYVDDDGNVHWPVPEPGDGPIVKYEVYGWYSAEGKDPLSHDRSGEFFLNTLNNMFHELNLLIEQPPSNTPVGFPPKPVPGGFPQNFYQRGKTYWIMIKINDNSAHPIFNDWRPITIP